MSKKLRDAIFFLFVFLFIAGSILISLYASGYQLDRSWPPRPGRLLVKTGMISVETEPRGATISLNGRRVTNFSVKPWTQETITTPARLRNILPGEYDVTLEREGYLPVTKRLQVRSGQTSVLEKVNLFRSDSPLLIGAASPGPIRPSSNYRYLYLEAEGRLIDSRSGQTIGPVLEPPTESQWLDDDNRFLVGARLVDPAAGSVVDFSSRIGTSTTDFRWDRSGRRLYYRLDDAIAYYDPASERGGIAVSSPGLMSYELRGGSLFLLAASGTKAALKKYSLRNFSLEAETDLPGSGQYRLTRDASRYLTVYDRLNKTLYLFNPETPAAGPKTIRDILSWQWQSDGSLLYHTAWEIHLYYPQDGRSFLLTRISQEINQIILNQRRGYLILLTQKGLSTYDLATGLTTTLLEAPGIISPVLDERAGLLYFWAELNGQAGNYSLLLQ